MLFKDIKEVGFYTDGIDIFEVINNTDEEWLKNEPNEVLVADLFTYSHDSKDGKQIYTVDGALYSLDGMYSETEIKKFDKPCKLMGEMGETLIVG